MKLTSKRWLAGLCGVLIMGVSVFCTSLYYTSRESSAQTSTVAPVLHSPNPNYEFLVGATAWQLSAESNALMMQAFTTAETRVQQMLEQCGDSSDTSWTLETNADGIRKMFYNGKRVAVICDIDDTLVDGAHYTADVVGNDGNYNNAAFARFAMSDACTALPGAVSFLNACVQSGIEVYYITNRYDQGYKVGTSDSIASYERSKEDAGKGLYVDAQGKEIGTTTYQVFGKSMYDITLEKMLSLGFPIDDQHLIVNDNKLNGSSKEAARAAVIDGTKAYPNGQRADGNSSSSALELSCDPHEVVMLFGDSINDFTDAFSDSSLDAVTRTALAQMYADKWGVEWIVLPNAMYGNLFDYASQYGFDALLKHFAYTAG